MFNYKPVNNTANIPRLPSTFISDFSQQWVSYVYPYSPACALSKKKKRKEKKINSVPQFADNVLLNLKEIKVLFLLDGSSVSV